MHLPTCTLVFLRFFQHSGKFLLFDHNWTSTMTKHQTEFRKIKSSVWPSDHQFLHAAYNSLRLGPSEISLTAQVEAGFIQRRNYSKLFHPVTLKSVLQLVCRKILYSKLRFRPQDLTQSPPISNKWVHGYSKAFWVSFSLLSFVLTATLFSERNSCKILTYTDSFLLGL